MDSGLTSTFTQGTVGTPAWSSPEQLDGKHEGEPSDVWSFGVVVWEVMTRQVPWAKKSAVEMIAASLRGQRLPMPEMDDDGHAQAATWRGLRKMLKGCWHEKLAKRPTFAQLLGTLGALAATHPDFWHRR